MACPTAGTATTEARFSGVLPSVTLPEIVPTAAAKALVGYKFEIPAMSSAPSGAALELELVLAVDITLEVSVCWRPSVCPNSCVTVVKKSSAELGPSWDWLKSKGSIIMESWIGTKFPLGELATGLLTWGPLKASKPGGMSSENTTSILGVEEVVPGTYRPPYANRMLEVAT